MIVIVVASYGLLESNFGKCRWTVGSFKLMGNLMASPVQTFLLVRRCQVDVRQSLVNETIRHVVRIVTFIMQPFRLKAFPVLFSSLPLLFQEFSTSFSLNSLFVSNAATMSGPAEVGTEASETAEVLWPEFPNFV